MPAESSNSQDSPVGRQKDHIALETSPGTAKNVRSPDSRGGSKAGVRRLSEYRIAKDTNKPLLTMLFKGDCRIDIQLDEDRVDITPFLSYLQ